MRLYVIRTLYHCENWYQNCKFHRDSESAIIYPDGKKLWFKKGKLHREDGPAIIHPSSVQHWYLNGAFYLEKDYLKEIIRRSIN